MTPQQTIQAIHVDVSRVYGPQGGCTSEDFLEQLNSEWAYDAAIVSHARDVVERMLERSMGGGKTALLLATALAASVIEQPSGRHRRLLDEISACVRSSAEFLENWSARVQTGDEVMRLAQTAAGGHAATALVLFNAIRGAGKFGSIRLQPDYEATGAGVREVIEPAGAFPVLDENDEFPPITRPLLAISWDPFTARQLESAQTLARNEARRLVCIAVDTGPCAAASGCRRIELGSLPEAEDWLLDLAALTGATVLNQHAPLRTETMGRAAAMVGYRDWCLVYEGSSDPNAVREQMDRHRAAIERRQDEAQRRAQAHLSALAAPLVEIVVSASPPLSFDTMYYNAYAGLHQARDAISGGFLPGGGVALAQAAIRLAGGPPHDAAGIVAQAFCRPLECLAHGGAARVRELLRMLTSDREQAFDPQTQRLHPVGLSGPLDATSAVAACLELSIANAAEMVAACN